MMEHLWAPWRMSYLQEGNRPDECFFCAIGCGDDMLDGQDLVVWRGQHVYSLLNRYPYANGHVMVVPYAHENQLDRLVAGAAAELLSGVQLMIDVIRHVYAPQGFNVGVNLGSAAGAGYGDHLHVHVVPRWYGDTNFMTTTGGTRVIPEGLAQTARDMRAALESVHPNEKGKSSE